MTSRLLLSVSLGAGAVALVAACSSSGGQSSGSSSGGASAGGSGAAVSVRGGVLVGPDGHALYENTVDTSSSITCTGACARVWPPLTGSAQAGAGVTAAELSTVQRPDGSVQVAFMGHPLYSFTGDKGAGDTSGDGVADGGGTWHVVHVGAAPASSTAPASGGSRYGY